MAHELIDSTDFLWLVIPKPWWDAIREALVYPYAYPFAGVDLFYWYLFSGTIAWIVLFLLLRWTCMSTCCACLRWCCCIPAAISETDVDAYAHCALGIVHAVFVYYISLPSFFILTSAPDEVKFAASHHIATCAIDESQKDLMSWSYRAEAVAWAGLAYLTYEIADVFIVVVWPRSHEMPGTDVASPQSCCTRLILHLVHHSCYIICGLMIRTNCMLPYNASIFLSMKATAPFLNIVRMLKMQGKSQQYRYITMASRQMYVLVFVAVRVVLNTYGVMYLTVNYEIAMPSWIPDWQYWLLLFAIMFGTLLQYACLPELIRNCCLDCGQHQPDDKVESDYCPKCDADYAPLAAMCRKCSTPRLGSGQLTTGSCQPGRGQQPAG